MKLILASSSPRRKMLLEKMGFEFEIIAPQIDETVQPGEAPAEFARRMAMEKARDVAQRAGSALIIAADTVVDCRGKIVGKPADRTDAFRILVELSGTTHSVITGICVLNAQTGEMVHDAVSTAVTMKPMTASQISEYISSGEADGKAGAYAIQETGDRYVEKIDGSFDNVVGLPTERLAQLLEEPGMKNPPCV